MTKNILLLQLAIAALCGCAASPLPAPEPLPDEPSARVRFFGNLGHDVTFFRNTSCIPKDDDGGTKVSGGIGQSLAAKMGTDQTQAIGMPESRRSKVKRDATNGTEFSNEYRVAAGRPLSFSMTYQQSDRWVAFHNFWSDSCKIPGSYIVPQAGKDYDVYLDQQTRDTCLATAMEIVDASKSVRTKVESADKCS